MVRNFAGSERQGALLCVAAILMLMLFGCQRRTENIAGIEIPIPGKMTKNADTPIDPVPGVQDGQVSYQGKVTPAEIFTFYQEIMAADGWQPTARYADKDNRIAYTKGNRLVLIRYDQTTNGTTILTVLVGTQDPTK